MNAFRKQGTVRCKKYLTFQKVDRPIILLLTEKFKHVLYILNNTRHAALNGQYKTKQKTGKNEKKKNETCYAYWKSGGGMYWDFLLYFFYDKWRPEYEF